MTNARHAVRQLLNTSARAWLPAPPSWKPPANATSAHQITYRHTFSEARRLPLNNSPLSQRFSSCAASSVLSGPVSENESCPAVLGTSHAASSPPGTPMGDSPAAEARLEIHRGMYSIDRHGRDFNWAMPESCQSTMISPQGDSWGRTLMQLPGTFPRHAVLRGAEFPQGRGYATRTASVAAADGSPVATKPLGFAGGKYKLENFPPERIRNFGIIAHVDHGEFQYTIFSSIWGCNYLSVK